MNEKEILLDIGGEQSEVSHASHRRVWSGLLAAVICLLLACVVWVCVMNAADTDYIPVRVVSPAGYECALSVEGVEVEGTVATLRDLDEIVVVVSAQEVEYLLSRYGGEAIVNESFLQLPADVCVSGEWSAVLSAKKK